MFTEEQYLNIERQSESKSEYFAGEMFTMSGVRQAHVLIAGNLYFRIRHHLEQRSCEVYLSAMRLRVNATGLYTYPDLSAVCGEPEFLDDVVDTLLNPVLIAEVLSPSTESYDRGRKFEHYRCIPSLQQYLLVSSDRIGADLYTRQSD